MSDALVTAQQLPADRGSPASRRPRSPSSARRTAWSRRGPRLPALLYMIVVTQVPFLVTLWYSFRGWNSLVPGSNKFVGFSSFSTVLSDPMFRQAALVTVEMTASAVILSMLLGTTLAILINRKFRGRGIVRTMLITPFLVIPVATGLLFQTTIYGSYFGILDWIVSWFGISQVTWASTYALPSVVAVLVWEWTPFMMLIVLAGLQSESLEALEAAGVDGANAFQTFVSITFPHLRRYIELGLLLGSIYIVQTFGEIFILTQGGGGNGNGTTNFAYYIYKQVANADNYSLGAAAGVIVVIATEIIAAFALRLLSGLFQATEGT